jgi:hypothetical protein
MDRRTLLMTGLKLTAVAAAAELATPLAAMALPVDPAVNGQKADAPIQQARAVVVVAPPRRRRVCWWRHGRRVCAWR